jgi:hypothetical protein
LTTLPFVRLIILWQAIAINSILQQQFIPKAQTGLLIAAHALARLVADILIMLIQDALMLLAMFAAEKALMEAAEARGTILLLAKIRQENHVHQ